MAISKKVSTLINTQVPEFIRTDAPLFKSFVEGYYEFLEQGNNVLDESRKLLAYQDVDSSIDKYIEYLKRELIPDLPQTTAANTHLLMKRATDLYKSRGSEKSYRLLFRALYNEEVEIYDPGASILRASDGRYSKEQSIRVGDPSLSNTELLLGQTITGLVSNATGKVERSTQTVESGFLVRELFLSNVSGTFQDLELVRNTANTVNATIYNVTGVITNVNLVDKGAGHVLGDTLSISSPTSVNSAIATISDTDNFSAVQFTVTEGGSGYTISNNIIAITQNQVGVGASFYVNSISNTEVLLLDGDDISSVANVPLNTTGGTTNSNTNTAFVRLGANSRAVSANLATANVNSKLGNALAFTNTTVGSINTIYQTSYGYNYTNLPSVSVRSPAVAELRIPDPNQPGSFKGNNAIITASNLDGAVKAITVTDGGTNFNKYDTLTIDNTTRTPTANVTGLPAITGIKSYEGKYTDTKGFLSWNNRLQDNYFYQVYSYVIKSNNALNKYKQFVDDLLHPAGTKMFGEVRTISVVSTPTILVSNVNLTTGNTTFDSTALTFDSSNTTFDKF
tara:strand:- start:4700 stop:6397 length:1698 start_codon:yes stop_codon:yes gene_type:complete